MKENIVIDKSTHELEVQPYTLIFNSTNSEISYPERIVISPDVTLKYFEEKEEVNIYEECFFRLVITDFDLNFDKENLKSANMGVKHLIGLISLTLKYILENKKFMWKLPESFIHPKYQGNLADLMIVLNNSQLFIKFIENIKNGNLINCQDVHDKFFKVICCGNLKNFVK